MATRPSIFIRLTSALSSVSLVGEIRSFDDAVNSKETRILVSTSTRLSDGVYLMGVPVTVTIEYPIADP